jgi:hypothetical protein
MQNVNIGLNWWLAHGTVTPEVVLVRATVEGRYVGARRVIGPEVWVPFADMWQEGEWCGPVVPPATLTASTLLLDNVAQEVAPSEDERILAAMGTGFPLADESDQLPPPPAEIYVPDLALPPAPVEDTKPESTLLPCPPEVEAMLGKEKDTVVAAQYGLSVNTVAEWRKERGIVRFRTKPSFDTDAESVVTVEAAPAKPRTATDESALSDLVARRFSEGASDEDMAQEAGVAIAKVVNARLALGLQRPRGRKPGVPQKRTATSEEGSNGSTATDAELDALLGEAV